VDWPSYGGDARRSGWEKSDYRITKDNVKDFQLVLKRKFDKEPGGPYALSAPVVIGLLISYKGFKELGFVAGNSGNLWAIDVDTNRLFWNKDLDGPGSKAKASGTCPGGMTATPALTPPVIFGARRTPAPAKPASPSPGLPPTPAGRSTALPARIGGSGFGAPRPVYALTSDGKLHQLNTSNGTDQFPPLDFLPANANASSLTMDDHVMYTTTSGNCGGVQNGVWALDLAIEEPKTASFPLKGGEPSGPGGFAVGNDGTVYVQTGPGEMDAASGKFSNTLLALSAKDLKLQHYFTSPATAAKNASHLNAVTPVVFEFKGRDLIASAGPDGRLYLLDSKSLGGEDHKTSLSQTSPVSSANGGIWGGLSTWEDSNGTRWIAAPVWGAVNPELKAPVTNGAAPNGSIVAFKVEEQNGKPALTPVWVSRDMNSPEPPVLTSGMVFALSTGGYTAQSGTLRPKSSSHATLYALDGETGKEMYSTGNQVTAPGSLTGLTIVNGRVYFTTTDSTLYAFGIFLEI
jgi:outer membrane protein assembly factor BamB